MAENLSRKLENKRFVRILPGLQIARGVKNMNYSQFANNTLLLGGKYVTIAVKFKQVLDSFIDASRGVVNHMKCQIMGCNS